MSAQGHNSGGQQLRAFIERIERVEEEIKSLNADKSEIYKEARGNGFDVKTMRKVVTQGGLRLQRLREWTRQPERRHKISRCPPFSRRKRYCGPTASILKTALATARINVIGALSQPPLPI